MPESKRTGPRPLPLHLWMAASVLMSSRGAFEILSKAWPSSPPGSTEAAPAGEAADPRAELGAQFAGLVRQHAALGEAIDAAARRRLDAFLRGIEAYRNHGYAREVPEVPAVWQSGTTRLLDYAAGATDGAAVLFVPSLINRAHVLDLNAERSLLRWLKQRGLRPLLLDWDAPGAVERGFGLDDYITGRVEQALAFVAERDGRAPLVAGYCMGGLLAMAAAARRPELMAGLALVATPWDFHADNGEQSRLLGQLWGHATPLFDVLGEVPVDALQCLFFALDPLLALRKFAAFAAVDPGSTKAAAFVALEDWINEGVPLATRVATECFTQWYGENRPAAGRWRVGGQAVLPSRITVPTFVACPMHDRIVPPGSSLALARQIGHALVLQPPLGHVGMIVGSRAREAFWEPFAAWLLGLDQPIRGEEGRPEARPASSARRPSARNRPAAGQRQAAPSGGRR